MSFFERVAQYIKGAPEPEENDIRRRLLQRGPKGNLLFGIKSGLLHTMVLFAVIAFGTESARQNTVPIGRGSFFSSP